MSCLVVSTLVLLTLLWALLNVGLEAWSDGQCLEECIGDPEIGSVRAVVPARDEESVIAGCVSSLVASQGVQLVLRVVDDGSVDDTASLARGAMASIPWARVESVDSKPAGWSGKSWACQVGARDAKEEWLLFVDADVEVHHLAVASAVATAEARGFQMMSLFGTWRMDSFWVSVALPVVGWFVRGTVDLQKLNRDSTSTRPFANGQFILIRSKLWHDLGGHSIVKESVLDDLHLAKAAVDHGARIGMLYAPWAFTVYAYDGLNALVQGYRKNLYIGMGRNPALAIIAALTVFVSTVLPPILVGIGLLWGHWAIIAMASTVVGLEVLFRYRVERRDGRSGLVAPLHPLGGAVLVVILLMATVHKEAQWKGRRFIDGVAQ